MIRTAFLQTAHTLYELVARPLMFKTVPAQEAHEQALKLSAWFDERPMLLEMLRQITQPNCPVTIGGVKLANPMIMAAGFVKGTGFASEDEALWAVKRGENIIPGWRSIPALAGAVEFGSFTRYPRLGNQGNVFWRNIDETRSLQNRVGLRNPGAKAAAAFLSVNKPIGTFGINIAVSPGVSDAQQETQEVLESLALFLERGVRPSWFTINLSCPNTEDDPAGNQTEDKAYHLCQSVTDQIENIPLWVKISPNLSPQQRAALMRAFAETGVSAVIATNTLPKPTPDNPQLTAGASGSLLFDEALDTIQSLLCEKEKNRYSIDVIGCGGILDGATYHTYKQLGVLAVQYWSALVYRGPLAAALILNEAENL